MNAVLLGLVVGIAAPALKDKPGDIVGTWVVESIQTTGTPSKPGGPLRYQFTTDGIWRRMCADRQYGSDHRYTLDRKADPVAIDLISVDEDMHKEVQVGIASVEGDTMRLCLNRRGGRRPTEFAAGPDSPYVIYVLKRLK